MKLLHVEIDNVPQTLIFDNKAELREFIRKARMIYNLNMKGYKAGQLYKWTTYSVLEQAQAKALARLDRMQRQKRYRLTRAHRRYMEWKWQQYTAADYAQAGIDMMDTAIEYIQQKEI